MRNSFFVLLAFTLIPFSSYSQMFGGQLKSAKVSSITSLGCASANNNGILTQGIAAIGVSSILPYTGGNGDTHNGQTVTSIGVSGLTAVLAPGSFGVGSGSLNYSITGTPIGSVKAIFLLKKGGQSCSL
jgi:hypothetical protein